MPSDNLPRLVCVSGRTESGVARILNNLESRTVDADLIRLLHAIHDDNIQGHVVRGFTLLGKLKLIEKNIFRIGYFYLNVLSMIIFYLITRRSEKQRLYHI